MKKLTWLLVLTLCFSLVFNFGCGDTQKPDSGNKEVTEKQQWTEDNTLKILMVGNSFADDTMHYAREIADSLKLNTVLGYLFIPNCTLDTHADNAKANRPDYDFYLNKDGKWTKTEDYPLNKALRDENWDFVTLQQGSGSSGMNDTFGQMEYLIGYIEEVAPKANLSWAMTWAYQQNSGHREFVKYNKDQMTMYNKIIECVKTKVLTHSQITSVVPMGTAIQNARTSKIGDNLTRDGHHLSQYLGRYIAGLTLIHTMSGKPIEENEFAPSEISEDERKIAVESVNNAIKNMYEVTPSEIV